MAQHLDAAGLDPIRVGAGEVGLARLRYERPDVLVLDLMLPGLDGWALIEQARSEGIGTPILVVSARGTEHDRVHALADRRRRLPGQAVLDEGARRPRRGRGAPRRARPARGPRRGARDRGAAHRPALGAGVRRRRERRADADRVPAPLRAGAGPRPRGEPRRAAPADLGPASHPPRPHRRRLRQAPAREDRQRASRHTFIQTRYGVGYSLEPVAKKQPLGPCPRDSPSDRSEAATASPPADPSARPRPVLRVPAQPGLDRVLYSSRYIGTRLFSASFSIRATISTYGSRPEPCSFDFSSSSTW